MNFVEKFLSYLKFERNFSEYTIIGYKNDLMDFFKVVNKIVSDVKLDDVHDYLKYLYDRKFSNSTVSRRISSLKSFFKYLYNEGVIDNNVLELIGSPKKEKKLPNYLNYDDLDKLLNTPDLGTVDGVRDALILELLYSTGIRVSELCNIRMQDIDFSDKKILIFGKGSKERYTYFGIKCENLMRNYMENVRTLNSDFLLQNKHGNKLNERLVRQYVANNLKKSGVSVAVSPHTLRHTYATHMLNEGADLKSVGDLLGHENLSTTQIYTHVSNERLRNVYLNCHPRAKKR